MSRLRHLAISNFRGIRSLAWDVPDGSLLCLIGRGDATKSTVLEAVRRVFSSQWNLPFDDADFHGCKPSGGLRIEAVITDFPDAFRDLSLYGYRLSGWDRAAGKWTPEPGEAIDDALRVRLAVGEDLEPSWRIIKADDDEGVPFKPADRDKLAVTTIGAGGDRHLTWSRGSILGALTESANLTGSLAEAARAARATLETRRQECLAPFDAVAAKAEIAARELGVRVAVKYQAQLDPDAIDIQLGGLALHDGDVPLRQLGLGSRRVLSTGLQKSALASPHITLIDEVEAGLEPHRIARLLHNLGQDKTGQYLLTTHSPVTLRELTVDQIHVVHAREGAVEIVNAAQPGITELVQGKLRAGAEAFLAPRIIVCEGATEAGFLRGLDEYWMAKGLRAFAYQGVATCDARAGNQVLSTATAFLDLHYDVAVVADSDRDAEFSAADAGALRAKGAIVVRWDDAMHIEQRAFADMAWPTAIASFRLACALDAKAADHLRSQGFADAFAEPQSWTDGPAVRAALGNAAASSAWFKKQFKAQQWAHVLAPDLENPECVERDFYRQWRCLRDWIDRD